MINIGDTVMITTNRSIVLSKYYNCIGTIRAKTAHSSMPNSQILYYVKMDIDQTELALYDNEFKVVTNSFPPIDWDKMEKKLDALYPVKKFDKCLHEFKLYVGIIQAFEYCIKCDAKKGKAS